jgi:hypothetical protein
MRLLWKQEREHESRSPGGRAHRTHGVIFAKYADTDRLVIIEAASGRVQGFALQVFTNGFNNFSFNFTAV